jgi:lipopolysaccharide/colanic/teichoic acid biosynthesis glycosyltransferase
MRRFARWLLVAGTVATVAGLSKLHAAEVADPAYDYTGSSRFAWSLAFIGLLVVASYGAGLPDLVRESRSIIGAALAATTSAALGISAVQLFTGTALLPRFVVFGSVLVLTPFYVACTAMAAGGRRRALLRDRVVVVASEEAARDLRDELDRAPEQHADVVGQLLLAAARPLQERSRPLVEAVVSHSATVVVLDAAAQADEAVVAQAAALHESGIRVRSLSLFYQEWLGKISVADLERMALMFDIGEVHRARYGRLKRIADIGTGVVGLVALAVMLPIVLVGNALANRGSLFYAQERVGRWGRPFRIHKLRTMRTDALGAPTEWTGEDDSRITRFGRILRITHVDELPQVINILRGDLSIVGPRPEQPRYVAELVEKIPFYDLRHRVRPGLTGWAQVKYGYAGNEQDAVEKLQYDFYYLRHQGLRLDARIVVRTIRNVAGLGGR